MKKEDKERVVAELTERIRTTDTLIVADYRGLTMPQIDELRSRLLEHGARFAVVKNTLTRRAAEAAGADALLALLEGPTAIAFLDANGDPVAVAKALADAARTTRVLAIRGGLLEGRPIEGGAVEELAKLPPADVLRAQVLGAITAPLTAIVGLFTAPLQDLYGLIDARIEQLREQGDTSDEEAQPSGSEPQGDSEPAMTVEGQAAQVPETAPETPSGSEPQGDEGSAATAEGAAPESAAQEPAETEETTETETQTAEEEQ
jgi:large subunit ribosomal protein L10